MRFSVFFAVSRENGLPAASAIRKERPTREVRDVRYGRHHLVVLLSVLLTSCYATSSSLDLREKTPVPAGESIVFGRVNVILDDVPVNWKFTAIGGQFRILVQSDATSQAVSHGLTGNGFFVWHLPPGSYTIAGFHYHVGTSGRIMARFTVPTRTPLLYVGTLEIPTTRFVLYRTNIVDEFDDANRELRTRFPELQGNAVKSLMKLEGPN